MAAGVLLTLAEAMVVAEVLPPVMDAIAPYHQALLVAAAVLAGLASIVVATRDLAPAAVAMAVGRHRPCARPRGRRGARIRPRGAGRRRAADRSRRCSRRERATNEIDGEAAAGARHAACRRASCASTATFGCASWNPAAAALLGLDEASTGARLEDLLGLSLAQLPATSETVLHRTPVGGLDLSIHREPNAMTVVVHDPGIVHRCGSSRSRAASNDRGAAPGTSHGRAAARRARARGLGRPADRRLQPRRDPRSAADRGGRGPPLPASGGGRAPRRRPLRRDQQRARHRGRRCGAARGGPARPAPRPSGRCASAGPAATGCWPSCPTPTRAVRRPSPTCCAGASASARSRSATTEVAATLSVGVAVMRPGEDLDFDGLLARAEEALGERASGRWRPDRARPAPSAWPRLEEWPATRPRAAALADEDAGDEAIDEGA